MSIPKFCISNPFTGTAKKDATEQEAEEAQPLPLDRGDEAGAEASSSSYGMMNYARPNPLYTDFEAESTSSDICDNQLDESGTNANISPQYHVLQRQSQDCT